MTLALEQAGSRFTGWIRSCLSCLSPAEDKSGGHPQNERDIEQEMSVCQNQPHLVPPMRLRVYDDLPSPNRHHQHRHSVSSWIADGRNLASRATSRASMLNPRRKSSGKMRISRPSDFRTVDSFQSAPLDRFQPLELSIYGGDRLSDLPSFESFQMEDDRRERETLATPPRALPPVIARSRRCQSTQAAFHVPRKPVGSGERRRSLSDYPEQPIRITSALIPHFSIVNPVEINPQEGPFLRLHERSVSYDSKAILINQWPSRGASDTHTPWYTEPRTQPASKGHGYSTTQSQSISSAPSVPLRIPSMPLPSSTFQKRNASGPSLSSRMTQWFFPSANKTSSSTSSRTPNAVSTSSKRTNSIPHIRYRTSSVSTVTTSTTTTITGGGGVLKTRPTNSSISSTVTSGTTPLTSICGPSPSTETEKDIEAGVSLVSSSHSAHPTIYEDPQQQGYRGSVVEMAF